MSIHDKCCCSECFDSYKRNTTAAVDAVRSWLDGASGAEFMVR